MYRILLFASPFDCASGLAYDNSHGGPFQAQIFLTEMGAPLQNVPMHLWTRCVLHTRYYYLQALLIVYRVWTVIFLVESSLSAIFFLTDMGALQKRCPASLDPTCIAYCYLQACLIVYRACHSLPFSQSRHGNSSLETRKPPCTIRTSSDAGSVAQDRLGLSPMLSTRRPRLGAA